MIAWITSLQARLGSASDGGITLTEISTVDPLKKVILARLKDPMPGKSSWIAFQIIIHAFAAANDCAIHKIQKSNDLEYRIAVLIKKLRRPRTEVFDPFVDPWKSNATKRKEAFHQFLRDKAAELEKETDDKPEPTSPLPPNVNLWCR